MSSKVFIRCEKWNCLGSSSCDFCGKTILSFGATDFNTVTRDRKVKG